MSVSLLLDAAHFGKPFGEAANGMGGVAGHVVSSLDKVANAGPFFNKIGQRPKTISEVLLEILY